MSSKSKAKGNRGEYAVRDMFTEWYGRPFVKTPNSGALRWGGILWVYGDLCPPEDFPFVIESKNYDEVSLDEQLGRRSAPYGTGQVADWWYDQAVSGAARAASEQPVEEMLDAPKTSFLGSDRTLR